MKQQVWECGSNMARDLQRRIIDFRKNFRGSEKLSETDDKRKKYARANSRACGGGIDPVQVSGLWGKATGSLLCLCVRAS